MNVWRSMAVLWVIAALMMTLGWRWQCRHGNAGIVDVLWAAGLGGGAVLMAVLGGGSLGPRAVVAVLGGLWGARLARHLWRRVSSEVEDGRYRHLRAHWNGHQGRFFAFFQFQALLIVLFALPFAAVAWNPVTSWPWLVSSICIWIVSVTGEAVADWQLAQFRSNPAYRGHTCCTGLWRYSRHPNYFFEWLHWFTYVAMAITSPLWWMAWVGPTLMFVFLRWISGIPFTEAQALRTRGEEYRAYQLSTPMLFPWFPRQLSRKGSES